MKMGSYCVPVIDMLGFPGECKKLVEAFEEWGCFRIINHGIPETLMAEMKGVARCLVDLPLEIKQQNAYVMPGKGYVPINMASPFFESLCAYDMDSSLEAVHNFCDQLHVEPHQRETILRHSRALYELAQDLGRKLLGSMGLAGDLFKGWICQFRLNKCNFNSQSVGLTGTLMHTDLGFLTILQDDDIVGGLEVMDKNSEAFIPIDPMPGSLCVNIGDMAKLWSNGRFHNVKHRVQCKEGMVRVSISLFVLGPKDTEVEIPQELLDSEHPRLYVPIKLEDYRMLRHTVKSPTGEALELLRGTKS